ncbi:MAG: DUF3800 domain-containing protein [Nanoarchaeota archaeon]|nr:DUF3800 domain-containing protein [Nanoarchaeota archaeon]
MGELYYVFSDETGHWNNEDFYIRSWVLLSEIEYIKLENRIKLFKKINDKDSELKYKPSRDYSLFCELDFEVYFTLTFSNDFRERNFELITNVETQENPSFEINNKNIKTKIINTLKNSIFLNIYEYHHISNALKYFREDHINKNIIFMVDSPQCQNPDWRKMFDELSENLFKLKIINDSKKEVGVQFADILAGSLKKILSKLDGVSFNNFEKKIISNFNLSNGTNKAFMNNPQIIMWGSKYQEFVNKLEEIKNENKMGN